MNVLDLDSYRAALGEDAIRLDGQTYPLRQLTFREAIAFSAQADKTDFGDTDQVGAFVTRFAEVSGLPLPVLEQLSLAQLLACARFFSAGQQFDQARYDRALNSAAGAST
jgi:hypothetical protein